MDKNARKQASRDMWHKNDYELRKFLIEDGKKHPFALICPGGGYSLVCSFVEGAPYAERLNAMGYSAFVLYYHVRKKAKYPIPQQDVARALKEILDHAPEWNLETEGFSVWGASAGGHLAATFGTEKMGYIKYGLPKPGALILSYPVITMGEKTHLGSRKNHLGKKATPEMIEFSSVEKQITQVYPPTFLWCNDADQTVSPDNSKMLQQALENQGIKHEFVQYQGVDHGVGIGIGLACEGWFEKAVAFWEECRRKL